MSDPAIYLPPIMFEEIRVPNSVTRFKMMGRLHNSHHRESFEVPVTADTPEELEGLAQNVRYYQDAGWSFNGLCSNDEGTLYLSFYKMVPWTEEEIQEAKDWLEANPDPLADPVVWRKVATTVYEEGVKDEST